MVSEHSLYDFCFFKLLEYVYYDPESGLPWEVFPWKLEKCMRSVIRVFCKCWLDQVDSSD